MSPDQRTISVPESPPPARGGIQTPPACPEGRSAPNRQVLRPALWRGRDGRCGEDATVSRVPRFATPPLRVPIPTTPGRLFARCVLLLGGLLGAAGGGDAVAAATLAPPSSEQAVAAWLAADRWVREGQVPPAGSENARVSLDGVEAVSLLLRLGGRVVASADAEGGDEEMVRRATGRLLSACAASLRDRWPDEMHDGLRRDALLEVELAGRAEPLLGSSFAEAADSIDPGIDTLAVRRGDRWARAFPGRLLATGLAGDPAATFKRLASDTGLPRGASLRELLALDSIGLYRLPTIRLGQLKPRSLPVLLLRQDSATLTGPMDTAAIAELATGLLGHLERRLHETPPDDGDAANGRPAGLGLRGDLDPISGRHEPFVAPPLPQALAILAATRLAHAEATLAPAATALARRLLVELAAVDPIESPPLDHLDALAAIAIATELDPTLAAHDKAASNLAAAAEAAVGEAMGGEIFETLSPGLRAIVVAAAATGADRRGNAGEVARRLQGAWAGTDQAMRVGLLPWFAWAAARLPEDGGLGPELDRFRTRLLELQVTPSTEGTPTPAEDLVGGFDLDRGIRPRADARSVLPSLGLALMLADEDLTPRSDDAAERSVLGGTIASQRTALGFLARLTVASNALSRLPHGEDAEGGVRDAPWDPRQSTVVQALSLWWLAECLASGLP